MNRVLRRALDQGLALNDRLAAAAENAFDWLFLRESLVKSGLTPYDVIYAGDPMQLRYYPLPAQAQIEVGAGTMRVRRRRLPTPLVLVPPLGVTTETFDLLPQRSLVRYMASRGFHTYLVDWGRPERRHAGLSIADYADHMLGTALREVRAHSGSQSLSLMGWCMGGLLCLIHLGLTADRQVKNLVTVASPIDLRGGGIVARAATALNAPARLIRKFSALRLERFDPSLMHAPGWLTTLSFKLTDPIGSITTYWDLITRLWDREFVESHTTTSAYLNNMLLYPGGVIRDLLVKIAVDNKLAAGRIEIGERVADFRRIRANLLAFAGDSDHLVAPEIARKSVELVGGRDKEFRIAPGGHMGVILGRGAQEHVWEPAAQWLEQRSARRRPATGARAERDQHAERVRRAREDPTV